MQKKVKILCVLNEQLKPKPSHLKFAATNLKDEALNKFKKEIDVEYIYFSGCKTTVKGLVLLTMNILRTKHDVLYYGTDPNNLFIISLLKLLGIYRKPMYAWKYTEIGRTGSKIKDFIKWILYFGYNKIFMLSESHVETSLMQGLMKRGQLKYLKWGEDLKYIDKCKTPKNDKFTFISTGKAYRDFSTMFKAFSRISDKSKLIVYLPENWGGYKYGDTFGNTNIPNVEIIRVGKNGVTLDKIYGDLFRSHCSLCICMPVNFGVGYTQILDSMACGLPVIWTYNKDNPIDIENTNTGVFVPPGDVDALADAMQKMIEKHENTVLMSKNARNLIESEYDIKLVAENVLSEIIDDLPDNLS